MVKKITKEIIEQFFSEQKIELKCTQTRLCIPIVDRIYRKMGIGLLFPEIKVSERLICDGHHRYVASLIAERPIETVPSVLTAATAVVEWNSVILVGDDWDTPAKIKMLNEQDAIFNNIPFDEFVNSLK